jgi:hypothetical protein
MKYRVIPDNSGFAPIEFINPESVMEIRSKSTEKDRPGHQ